VDRRRARLMFGILLISSWPTMTLAQGHCRPGDSTAAVFLAHIVRYASAESGEDAAVRDSLRLHYTPRARVHLVSDEQLCSQAAAAYRADLTTAADTHTGRVYVVQASDRFAVLDLDYHIAPRRPGVLHGENWIIAIFDSTWRRVSLF
jgi:hypothetical protein